MKKAFLLTLLCLVYFTKIDAQAYNESQLGAWYMYFYNVDLKNSNWGFQGDFQYRDWSLFGDREQLLLRSGVTYKPKNSGVMLTLGFANITTGKFGKGDNPASENRIYQEAIFSNTLFGRILLTHRFRYEQRWSESKDFKTRYRYNIFANIPFNNIKLLKNTYYFAFYNEVFLNGQRNNVFSQQTDIFDRNRTYLGFGYAFTNKLRVQLGWMNQTTTNWQKGQLQFSLHQRF